MIRALKQKICRILEMFIKMFSDFFYNRGQLQTRLCDGRERRQPVSAQKRIPEEYGGIFITRSVCRRI